MSAVCGWPQLSKMWQNRLFCGSMSVMQTRSISISASRILCPNVRYQTTFTRCSVFNRIAGQQKAWGSQFPSSFCNSANRNLASLSFSIPSQQIARAFSVSGTPRSAADIPKPEENLIYSGPLSNMVKMVKLFSLSTSGISVLILQMMFMTSENGVLKLIGGSMASILLLTPIVLHWITKSYVTKIYFDHTTDTYTAYTLNFFLTTSKREFTSADVETPAVRNLMTSFVAKGKPLLVNPSAFFHPNHYSHLMGYDKLPENFSVEEIEKAMEEDMEEAQRKDR